MPKNPPPEYPKVLTKTDWDKKKGIFAKIAGATGVGAAAKAAEDEFDKIDWLLFTLEKAPLPMPVTDETVKTVNAYLSGFGAYHEKHVGPTVKALKSLSQKASAAKKKFSESKTIPKSSVKVAEDVASEADMMVARLLKNGVFFTNWGKTVIEYRDTVVKNLDERKKIMKETATYLTELLKGVVSIKSAKTVDSTLWDDKVKQHGRSVSNNLKGNVDLAKKYLKKWTAEFQGFDWVAVGFSKIKDPAELLKAVHTYCDKVISEGKILAEDLK